MPIYALVRNVLKSSQLFFIFAGMVPSSRTLVTWYEYWFQIRGAGIQRSIASRRTVSVGALLAFDVRECALVKYAKAHGAPEIVSLICALDDLMNVFR